MAHIERLLDAGLAAEHIGVITPYNGQVAALRELRGDRLAAVEISSVDGFQGGVPHTCTHAIAKHIVNNFWWFAGLIEDQ